MSGAAVRPTEAVRAVRAVRVPARRLPAALAVILVVLGVLAVAVRLDAPADGARVTAWLTGGVVIATDATPRAEAGSGPSPGLVTGDVVRVIGGRALTERPGTLAEPAIGTTRAYEVDRGDRAVGVAVEIARPAIAPLVRYGWGNLVFVVVLALLAVALYVRRPEEPATAPLLVVAGELLGSTLAVVAGVPPLAMATGGPVLWLYNLNTIGVYAVAWGALPVFALLLPGDRRVSRPVLVGSAVAAPLATATVVVLAGLWAEDWMGWLADVSVGTSAIVAATLLACGILGVLAYLRSDSPDARARHLWVGGGTVLTVVLGLVGWHLPQLVLGHSLLPAGALGLSGLPFIVGVGVALRRHRLFDIERLANRSLIYLAVTAVLVAGYAILVALLGSVLGLSGGVSAALAAAVAAVVLAPLLRLATRGVNRLMYGDRDDPAGALARLGRQMQAVLLPDDVLPVVVETVALSLRLPHVAIDLTESAAGDAGDRVFRTVAEHGLPGAQQHSELLTHHGTAVGRLRVSDRGPDDPLDSADLSLLASLAAEIGPAVQAVRLHQDLLRSRAEVVALREDERRRLRRDLHDGLGPALAAIGLKAGLARREVDDSSAAYLLLGEIDAEVKVGLGGIRRLVEGLRPPALDELGLIGALRSRAASLAGDLAVVVEGAVPDALPAAVETAAYRIAVEAMTNAARHSAGSHCHVEVGTEPGTLVVVVSDDGGGLDPRRRAGVGLRSMQERATELGGTLSVRPSGADSASGTVVTARLPLTLGRTDGHPDPR
ncbi:MAG TPA: histidine kinase [Microlunatus sp.]